MADLLPKLFIQNETPPDFDGGACTFPGLDPETWFLDDPTIAAVAKGYCQLCPYGPGRDGDDSCFRYFIKIEELTGYFAYGIVGGRSAAKRQRILDRKKLEKELADGPGQADQESL